MVTFDGPNKLINLESGVTSYDVLEDIYEPWKEFVLSTSSFRRYDAALRNVGGDDIIAGVRKVGTTTFLANGWKFLPPSEDIYIVMNGNLFVDESGTYGVNRWIQPGGAWNVGMEFEISNLVDTLVQGSGVTSQDKIDIALQSAVQTWEYNIGGFEDAQANPRAGSMLNENNLALIQKFVLDQDLGPDPENPKAVGLRVTKVILYRRDQSPYIESIVLDRLGQPYQLEGTTPTDRGEPLYMAP